MCSAPDAPKPVAPRQAARMPDAAEIKTQNDDALRRRQSLAAMTFTPAALAPADTAGKPTLGA